MGREEAHTYGGNCWKPVYTCGECGYDNLCDVCHDHDEPRGGCSECKPCLACEAEEES